jgi:acetyltransferase
MELASLFSPRSIALIGASADKAKLGWQILNKLRRSHLPIFPINPHESLILNTRAYPSILDVPGPVDLAIVVVPAPIVNLVVEQAAEKKVKSIVVISAGFSETGPQGKKLEIVLKKLCQKQQINLLGPNVLGFANPAKKLDITFAKTAPMPGNIGLISQSGAIGAYLFDWAKSENLGFSKFVSLGNRAGLTETDFLTFLSADPDTKVIGLYLESFADGQRFLSITSRLSRKKPIVAIFGGQSPVGKQAVLSHTAALSPETAVIKTALNQTGCIQADNLESFTDLLEIFSLEPPLIDNDLVIVTNAGGPGVLASDQANQVKLALTPLSTPTAQRLKTAIPQAQINNPIDLIGDALAERFRSALNIIVQDHLKDAFLIILSPQTNTQLELTAKAIVRQFKAVKKPIVVCLLGGEVNQAAKDILQKNHLATIDFPQKAVDYLSILFQYWHNRLKQTAYPVRQSSLIKVPGLRLQPGQQTWQQIKTIAKAYHLPLVATKIVKENSLLQLIKEIGFPLVLKADPVEALHRTEKKALFLNLNSAKAVQKYFNQLKSRFTTILIQPQIRSGHELFIGLKRPLGFPPLLTIGSGGIYTEIYQDVAHTFLPVNKTSSLKLLAQTKLGQILQGARGLPPTNLRPVIDLILNVSQLALNFPQIEEININPAIIDQDKIQIVDIKITISPLTLV